MTKGIISIGSVVDYPTIHNKKVAGKVELILENTIVVRDSDDSTHLVLKSVIEEAGFSIDEKTHNHKTQYTKG